jgi:hypothetical protein
MQTLPWIVALAAIVLLVFGLAGWLSTLRRSASAMPLPAEWSLEARPVFSKNERRVFRLLREALPHHVLLAKLPLVRFCQPLDTEDTRYWYRLLGSLHVSFAICSANGRVLAVIDLESDHPRSRRALQIKESVLGACKIRYLRASMDRLPTVAELQLLVPQANALPRAPQPEAAPDPAGRAIAGSGATGRGARGLTWQDSSVFQDSFFSQDSRNDTTLSGAALHVSQFDDVGGVVVDELQPASHGR